MDKLLVTGPSRLAGTVRIGGSKNASLGVLAATLVVEGVSTLHNVPRTIDVVTMLDIMRTLGAKADFTDAGAVVVDATNITNCCPPYHLVRRMRGSFHVAGPLLTRLGRADIALPGGCTIGPRPVDFHQRGFTELGADVRQAHGMMLARCKRLKGTRIYLDPRYASVGTTLNLMMAATLAEGQTVIENASRDPDVCDAGHFLVSAGAGISGIGTSTMIIEGVDRLVAEPTYEVCGDRIEAGTYLVGAAVTRGDVTVTGIDPAHLERPISVFAAAGLDVHIGPNQVRVVAKRRPLAFDLVTAPYPGFPTDLQPPFAVMASVADGRSVLEEAIFDGRLAYMDELRRMNAEIKRVRNIAVIQGVEQLSSAPVRAPDLRAGAALILAGLNAEGTTEITGVENVDRGYEGIEFKMASLGAGVRRLPMLGMGGFAAHEISA